MILRDVSTITEWSYEQAELEIRPDGPSFPIDAMRHFPSGILFYMHNAITSQLAPCVCQVPPRAKKGRGWCQWKKEEQARAEYERLLAANAIPL